MEDIVNYYGSLCTEMYERLHPQAPKDELEFYLSYAKPGQQILEMLCGSGRFLLPFAQKGMDITGVDLSAEMLEWLKEKLPQAKVFCCGADRFQTEERYDYIFICANSVSLFTDPALRLAVFQKAKQLLKPDGVFVFSADTTESAEPGDGSLRETARVTMPDGKTLLLKMGQRYDAESRIQYYPSVYELWDGQELLQSQTMDFQTRLYRLGELDEELKAAGFSEWKAFGDFQKTPACLQNTQMLLYACR